MPLRFSALVLCSLLLAAPRALFANGGDQRIAGGRYMVNFSRSPFTPRVGEETKMLISFLDIEANSAVRAPTTLEMKIKKPNGTVLYESKTLAGEGVFELSYTFAEAGLHEIYAEFAFAREPERVYKPHHFLMDVEERVKTPVEPSVLFMVGVATASFLFGWFMNKKYT